MEKELFPKVSVLVPVYGVEKYIGQCAKTLFEQDYENIEYIFVNDCTKDKSIEVLNKVLEQYPLRTAQVVIIKHEKNKGLSAARNTALDAASGKYIFPIDSDDFLSSTSAITELIEDAVNDDKDAVFYDMQHFPQTSKLCSNPEISLDPKVLTKSIILRQGPINLSGALYKRSLFVNHNIRSIDGISFGEDYAIKPKLTYHMKRIGHIAKSFYCYRQENDGSMCKNYKLFYIENLHQCIEGFYDFFSKKPDFELYREAIDIAAIRCKIDLMRWWALDIGSDEVYLKIDNTFSGLKYHSGYLKAEEHFVYLCCKYKWKILLKVCAKVKHIIGRTV